MQTKVICLLATIDNIPEALLDLLYDSRLGINMTRHLRYYDYIPDRLVQFHETGFFMPTFELFSLTRRLSLSDSFRNGQNRETRAFQLR